MSALYGFTEARSKMSELVDQVEAGGIAVIERRGAKVMLTTVEDQDELLSTCFSFAPEVYFSPNRVELWLPELELHGEGANLAEAEDDLIEEVDDYVDDWERFLRSAPNHARKKGWVRRVQIAQSSGAVRELLFAQ
jgi:prevent-host-death family protein